MTVSVSTRGLTVEYVDGDSHLRPLDGLDLEAHDGELVILLGPSGSGKTTLLSCLAGLLTPTSGSVTVLDHELTALTAAERDRYRRETVGVVFQAFNLLSSLTALENVAVPMRLAGIPRAEARRRSLSLLERVGLSHRTDHKPAQLSGGQQQRVAIARAVALDPPVVLADEPTAHLDVVQVEGVITLMRSLATPGRTVIVSTHDERLIPLADRVVELGEAAPVADAQELAFAAGDVVFEEGGRSRHVYVLTSGAVEIVKALPDGGSAAQPPSQRDSSGSRRLGRPAVRRAGLPAHPRPGRAGPAEPRAGGALPRGAVSPRAQPVAVRRSSGT